METVFQDKLGTVFVVFVAVSGTRTVLSHVSCFSSSKDLVKTKIKKLKSKREKLQSSAEDSDVCPDSGGHVVSVRVTLDCRNTTRDFRALRRVPWAPDATMHPSFHLSSCFEAARRPEVVLYAVFCLFGLQSSSRVKDCLFGHVVSSVFCIV